MTYDHLLDFVQKRMRMSHIYQPVMLAALLRGGGKCSEREIAKELLTHDESHIEYYENIVRGMVGRVLRDHDLVTRDSQEKTWALTGYEDLSSAKIESLIHECQSKLDAFLTARGEANLRAPTPLP